MSNGNILVIADTHEPFTHRNYLEFCKDTQKKFKCKTVVHIGDLVDNHAISYHEHDPNGWSPEDEMRNADRKLKKWFKAFPEVYLCRGNHDRLVDRKGKTVGLPRRCFKDFRDMWELPNKWVDDFSFVINDVLFMHGTGRSGKNAPLTEAQSHGISTVIGHIHCWAGVQYYATQHKLVFGMNCGCGIDVKSYAFEYGKAFRYKPVLGCGVVFNKTNAQFVPMDLGEE